MDALVTACYGDQGGRLVQLFQLAGRKEQQVDTILITGDTGVGKKTSAELLATHFGFEVYTATLGDLAAEFDGQIAKGFRRLVWRARKSLHIVLKDLDLFFPRHGEPQSVTLAPELLKTLKDNLELECCMLIVGTSRRPSSIALDIRSLFQDHIVLQIPTPDERRAIIQGLTKTLPLDSRVDLTKLAARAHAFVAADLAHWCRLAEESAWQQKEEMISQAHFDQTFHHIRVSALQGAMAEKPDPVHWSDIGGLDHAKASLEESVVWTYKHADAFTRLGVRPSKAVLLHGPPGTGKTLLAKAVATEADIHFLPVSIPDLVKGEVGESEKSVARIFQTAARCCPCVIFLDELEAVFGTRESSGDVGRKLISQFLIEMDHLDQLNQSVLLLGATNHLDAIDSAILRPGRFDRLIYVGAPSMEERLDILKVLQRATRLSDTVDLAVVAAATQGYTGADLKAVMRKAGLFALKRHRAAPSPLLDIQQQDVETALAVIGPSPSAI